MFSIIISTCIYDLVLLNVCHSHHHQHQVMFPQLSTLSRYSCLHLGSCIQEFLKYFIFQLATLMKGCWAVGIFCKNSIQNSIQCKHRIGNQIMILKINPKFPMPCLHWVEFRMIWWQSEAFDAIFLHNALSCVDISTFQ